MDLVQVTPKVQRPHLSLNRLHNSSSYCSTETMTPSTPPVMAKTTPKSSIPFFYRISLLYAEPFFALCGALILYLSPGTFLTTMTPSVLPSIGALRPVRVFTDQLAAMQLLIAFNNGVFLRYAAGEEDQGRRHRLWRLCCSGMVLCDVLHVAASVRELGWAHALSPGKMWRVEDWVNFGILGWMGAVRLAVVLGIGLSDERGSLKRARVAGEKSAGVS